MMRVKPPRIHRVAQDFPRQVDFQAIFESVPDRYLLIDVDRPRYTVFDASDAYLELVMMDRDDLVGRGLFDIFPEESTIRTQSLLRDAIAAVLREKNQRSLAAYRYDMPDLHEPEHNFERYWSPSLIPILDESGNVHAILLRVEEATDFVLRERYMREKWSVLDKHTRARRVVLLIEPKTTSRTCLTSTFATYWEVEAVECAADALAILDSLKPDVVVTTMELPDMSGVDVIAAIKNVSTIPVIAMAAHTDGRRYHEAFEAGADDVIGGPASPREILARVQTQFAESALREIAHQRVHRQYRQLFMQAPVAISLVEGPERIYTLSNPALDELVGGRQLIGLPLREAFPEPDLQPTFDRLDEVYETGEPYFATEVRIVTRPDEQPRYVTFAYLPHRAPDGSIQGVAAFAYDVTEPVEMRKALERENERKDTFLEMLGHELRNPLTPIAHANELLRMRIDNLDTQLVDWATDVIQRQVTQLTHHVNDLLDVARFNQGHVNIERAPVALNDVLAAAIESVDVKMKRRHQKFVADVPTTQVKVDVDAVRMTQVLTNILENASKYTPAGGHIWLKVEIDEKDAQYWLRIEVRDDGEGIKADLLPDVFGLFVQAEVTPDRTRGGLGLGLPLVKGIVELHGGNVCAYSDGPGRGSRFVVEIPVAVSISPEIPAAAPGRQLIDKRILVVDDIPDLAESLALLLRAQGATVDTASSGHEAIEKVTNHDYTHILLDIGLPDIDGYEVAQRLRQLPEKEDVKIAALTGYGLPSDERKARKSGFDSHMTKPADIPKLFEFFG